MYQCDKVLALIVNGTLKFIEYNVAEIKRYFNTFMFALSSPLPSPPPKKRLWSLSKRAPMTVMMTPFYLLERKS